MNKKLLTLAVAAAMAAPTAAMAEAIIYGDLHVSVDYAHIQGFDTLGYINQTTGRPATETVRIGGKPTQVPITEAKSFNGWGVNGDLGASTPTQGAAGRSGRNNRIGFKGSEDLGNGLKAIYNVTIGVDLSGDNNTANNIGSGVDNGIDMQNTYVGLASDFGTLMVGRNDTPLKTSTAKLDLFADTMADYNATVGFDDVRADNAIAYVSPNFSGFQIAGAVISGGASTVGAKENINSNSIGDGYSVAGIYSNGPFMGSIAYEGLSNELYMSSQTSEYGFTNVPAGNPGYVRDDYTKWRVGLGMLDWNGFTLTGIYEEQSGKAGGQVDPVGAAGGSQLEAGGGNWTNTPKNLTLWQVQGGYAFGNSMIKAMYGAGERDKNSLYIPAKGVDTSAVDGSYSTWAVAFDYNFSKRTKAYILYNEYNDDIALGDWTGVSVGMIHHF